jgi:hypothetical protein
MLARRIAEYSHDSAEEWHNTHQKYGGILIKRMAQLGVWWNTHHEYHTVLIRSTVEYSS